MMSGELLASQESVTLLSAIESCSKHVTDLKIALNQRCTSLENKITFMTSSVNTIIQRIDALEKVVKISTRCENHRHQCCDELVAKMNSLEKLLKCASNGNQILDKESGECASDLLQSPVVLVHNNKPAQVSASVGLDSTVQVITLNSESDYPDGTWLGDESNPDSRVRCPITPPNLLHINTFCQTPEKMAVTLLDYLFPREVLAVSNLSGKGKHGKKQLDPLMIYGIRCHLLYKFNINEGDWYRIKQNMDSKCRTAWRKKLRGLPLGRYKTRQSDNMIDLHEFVSESGEPLIVTTGYGVDDSLEEMETQVIHTSQGDIKVLHATSEQLVRIQESQAIQVLSEDLILPVLQEQTQMLEAGASEVSAEYILPVGLSSVSSSEVSMDIADGNVSQTHLVEVQDISMSSQVLNASSEGYSSLDEGKSKHLHAFITV